MSSGNSDWVTRDLAHVWHPCTQMKDHETVPMIPLRAGSGVWLEDFAGKRYLDGISSWWVNLFGHCNPRINAAVREQLGQPRTRHLRRLHAPAGGDTSPKSWCASRRAGLNRCFFADNGSAAIEVAVKMSFHFWRNTGQQRKTRFITLANSYHGETLGALAVGNVDLYKSIYRPLLMDVITVPSPDAFLREPGVEPSRARAPACSRTWKPPSRRTTAKWPPSSSSRWCSAPAACACTTRCISNYCARPATSTAYISSPTRSPSVSGAPARCSPASRPASGLTICACRKDSPAATCRCPSVLTTDAIYDAFYDEYSKLNAFLHSHSYTGNPLACAAANATLAIFRDEPVLERNRATAAHMLASVEHLRDHPHVAEIRQCGMILAIELMKDPVSRTPWPWQERRGLRIYRHALERGALIRPLGTTIYFMPPYVIAPDEIDLLARIATEGIELACA